MHCAHSMMETKENKQWAHMYIPNIVDTDYYRQSIKSHKPVNILYIYIPELQKMHANLSYQNELCSPTYRNGSENDLQQTIILSFVSTQKAGPPHCVPSRNWNKTTILQWQHNTILLRKDFVYLPIQWLR